jgi:hypothetical protein
MVPVSDPAAVLCPKTGRPTKARTTRTKKNFEHKFLIGLLREWLFLLYLTGSVKQKVATFLRFLRAKSGLGDVSFSGT